jgi:hypothetical protein
LLAFALLLQPVLRAGAARRLDVLQHAVRQQQHDARQLHSPHDQLRLQRHVLQLRRIRERHNSHHVIDQLFFFLCVCPKSISHFAIQKPLSHRSDTFCASFRLTTALKPQCPGIKFVLNYVSVHHFCLEKPRLYAALAFRAGPHQYPPLIPPPTSSFFETYLGPSPTPMASEGGVMAGMAPTSTPAASSGPPPAGRHVVGDVLGAFALCLVGNLLW